MAAALGTNETIRDLGDFLASGGQHTIGALVFWSLSGVEVERDVFRQELEALGMAAAMPRDPRHSTSLRTALGRLLVGKANLLVRQVDKGWGLVVEQAVAPEPGSKGPSKLKHVHCATVVADPMDLAVERRREAGKQLAPDLAWTFTPTLPLMARTYELARETEEHYLHARRYLDTSDLSVILVNAMHGTTRDTLLGAVSLRQTTGGLYFVHSSKLEQLAQLRELVQRHAPKSDLTILTITGSADNLAAAGGAARQSFQIQLAELRKEVAEFRSTTPLAERTERSVTTRAAHFRQLAAKVELFRDVLGGITDELTREIDGAKGEVERLLDAE